MGKQVAQGTRHETSIVREALSLGRTARRTAKAGQANEADVIIEGTKPYGAAVVWKNYHKTGGKKRRSTELVVMTRKQFMELVDSTDGGWYLQAKATERLAVRATLQGLLDWMKGQGHG